MENNQKGKTMLTYFNDPKLKEMIVEEMKNHQKQDQIIKGTYGKQNGVWKGCAVGCAIHSINLRLGKEFPTDNHRVYEEAIGVPEWLARLQDTIFEGLPDKENSQFAVDLLEAIPVGVNLDKVKWKFCAIILKENIDRVLALKIKDELKEQVVKSIQQCLNLHEEAIKTGIWDRSAAESAARSAESAAESAWSAARSAESAAWSAESAARSVESVESAAWSAARSAAESAARSAAESAESAAYQRYAKELLRLLREAGNE